MTDSEKAKRLLSGKYCGNCSCSYSTTFGRSWFCEPHVTGSFPVDVEKYGYCGIWRQK